MKEIIAFALLMAVSLAGPVLAGDDGAADRNAKVKGSKSNTSERVDPHQGSGAPADPMDAGKVKSKKSNISDRTTVKSSKSNSSE